MLEFRLKDGSEAYEVIREAVAELGRTDTPWSYGVAFSSETKDQIVYFDLPRVSPLQFNVSTEGTAGREELVGRIKQAIIERLAAC